MGFEDRDYYRDGPRGEGTGLARVGHWLLSGRVRLFRAFGIDVAAHSSLIIVMVLTLLLMGNGFMWQDRVISAAMLFLIVLLHEFGHCFGARWSGGEADQIVMHPLGGLALTSPLPTWQSHLITSISGPLVNVVFCIVCGVGLFALTGQVPWKPVYLTPWIHFRGWLDPVWLLFWIYQTNWALLLFNLMPIYPLDGGQITQAALWPKVGYYRSMLLAATTGIVGAAVIVMIAIATNQIWLLILAILGLMTCIPLRRALIEGGPQAFGEYDDPYAQAVFRQQRENRAMNAGAHRDHGPTRGEVRSAKRAEKERLAAAAEEAEVDRILAKVSANGMHTLTRSEQKTLKHASERRRH
jgi:stage IV sporulation protein FB